MNMNYNGDQPFYLLRRDMIERYYPEQFTLMNNLRSAPTLQVSMPVTNERLNQTNPEEVVDFFKVLQHYPDLLERMVQQVHLTFDEAHDWVDDTGHNHKWDLRAVWFNELGACFPPSIFFLSSSAGRLLTLLGDEPHLMEALNLIGADEQPTINMAEISPYVRRRLTLKVRSKAAAMYTYCYGTGFDPSIYITAVIADLKMDLPLEEIQRVWHTSMELKQVADSIGMEMPQLWDMTIFY